MPVELTHDNNDVTTNSFSLNFSTCCVSCRLWLQFFGPQCYIMDSIDDGQFLILISLYYMKDSSCSIVFRRQWEGDDQKNACQTLARISSPRAGLAH